MSFKKSIYFFILSCLCLTAISQTNKIDSLEQVLASIKDDDINKGNLLIDLFNEYAYIDTVKSKTYLMAAINLSEKTGLEQIKKRGYYSLGFYYRISKQYHLSYINYKKAEKLCLELNDSEYLCRVYYNMMKIFLSIEIDDADNVGYYADKLLDTAAEFYNLETLIPHDTTKISEKEIIPSWMIYEAQFYKGIALIYGASIDLQDMLDYCLTMLQRAIAFNEITYKMFLATYCGNIYLYMDRPADALHYLNFAREIYELYFIEGHPTLFSVNYINIAEAHALLHQTDSADYYLKKVEHSSDPLFLEANYRACIAIASSSGNYKKALEINENLHHYTDSIFKIRKSTEISRLKNWNEYELLNNKNEILHQERKKQQKLLLLLSAGLLIIISLLVISIIFYRKSTKQNSELKKMHSLKDKIFSIISHDLRSPINSLANTLKLANSLTINTENKTRILKNVSSNVDNAYALIDNLLLWSKNQIKEIRPISENFNIQSEIKLIVDDLSNFADEKFIELENNTQKHSIYTDKDMFRVIMRNLMTNAIKYSHLKGKITINSELFDNNIVISVKDRGIGMTQAIQDTLFKLSETKSALGTNNETGTGLGLVLCAEFAKKVGGKICFNSKEGEGSTFFFCVPVVIDN